MKKSNVKDFLKIAAVFVVIIILFIMCAKGCKGSKDNVNSDPTASQTQKPEEEVTEPIRKVTINLKDDRNSDKVITEATFNTPSFTENVGSFIFSAIYGDNMVLQANMNCRLFGKHIEKGAPVAAELKNDATGEARTYYGQTDDNGEFEIWLGATDYGGPYTITVFNAEGNSVVFKNVLFGEVYVLAGQSNMGWGLGQCYDGSTSKLLYQNDVDTSENNNIRYMQVWPEEANEAVEYLSTVRAWAAASPKTVTDWSAAGYFFAERLNDVCDVPVGIVSACMGGTPISAWTTNGSWYKGMISPITKMTFRGVCWYQGEGDPENYANRLTSLIEEWRTEFENPDLYWVAVQLPRCKSGVSWAKSRDEIKAVKEMTEKYTYCVTLDTGIYPEWKADGDMLNDEGLHPYDKKPIGRRMADAAIGDFYGGEGNWTSPYVKDISVVDGKITLKFENVGEGLCLQGNYGFEVAGSDGKFANATPEIVGKDTVVLTCDSVAEPTSARYGYKNLRGDGIKSCAESVCVYSTLTGGYPIYPAEQFLGSVN